MGAGRVRGMAVSLDFRLGAVFDATPYLEALSGELVEELRREGWAICPVADAAVGWFRAQGDVRFETLGAHLDSIEGDVAVEFDAGDAEAWYREAARKSEAA